MIFIMVPSGVSTAGSLKNGGTLFLDSAESLLLNFMTNPLQQILSLINPYITELVLARIEEELTQCKPLSYL
jgi:hypothetical protein